MIQIVFCLLTQINENQNYEYSLVWEYHLLPVVVVVIKHVTTIQRVKTEKYGTDKKYREAEQLMECIFRKELQNR